MPKAQKNAPTGEAKQLRPPLLPENQEARLISMAVDVAEGKLKDGTAPASLIVEILRWGSSKYRLENDRLREENKKLKAQTESLQSGKKSEEFLEKVLKAVRKYNGESDEEEYDEW